MYLPWCILLPYDTAYEGNSKSYFDLGIDGIELLFI